MRSSRPLSRLDTTMAPIRVPYALLVQKPRAPFEFVNYAVAERLRTDLIDSLKSDVEMEVNERTVGLDGRGIREIKIYQVRPPETESFSPTHRIW